MGIGTMEKTVSMQWGGYYTSKSKDGLYRFFRLLDFTDEAYHAAIFQEKFTTMPTWSDVRDLKPFIGHAPISSLQFYHQEMTLIGSTPLRTEDLEGYKIYLDHLYYSHDDIEEIFENLIHNSQLGPLTLVLSINNDMLQVRTVP